jgi:deazaflavin-dependent oxidoreductase (nitroreductase family)
MPEARVRGQAPWFVKNILNPIMLATGGMPIISVRGRRTGRIYRTPIGVIEMSGAKYLVSPRGETTWSKNVRVTGEASIKTKGVEQRYRATEVPTSERAPIISAYIQKFGNTRSQFEKLPDPLDHPTFRLDPI